MTDEQQLDDASLDDERLEHIGAQTVDCEECNKTGIPLYELWDDPRALCATCLIKLWQDGWPADDE